MDVLADSRPETGPRVAEGRSGPGRVGDVVDGKRRELVAGQRRGGESLGKAGRESCQRDGDVDDALAGLAERSRDLPGDFLERERLRPAELVGLPNLSLIHI